MPEKKDKLKNKSTIISKLFRKDPINSLLEEQLSTKIGDVKLHPHIRYDVFPPQVRTIGVRGQFFARPWKNIMRNNKTRTRRK